MSKFDKRKIAATLAFASLFSGKSQAMETKSPQSIAAVEGAKIAPKNLPVKKSLSTGAKIGIVAASILTLGTVAALITWGVKNRDNKESEDAETDAEKQEIKKENIENQNVVVTVKNQQGENKNIVKTSSVNIIDPNKVEKVENINVSTGSKPKIIENNPNIITKIKEEDIDNKPKDIIIKEEKIVENEPKQSHFFIRLQDAFDYKDYKFVKDNIYVKTVGDPDAEKVKLPWTPAEIFKKIFKVIGSENSKEFLYVYYFNHFPDGQNEYKKLINMISGKDKKDKVDTILLTKDKNYNGHTLIISDDWGHVWAEFSINCIRISDKNYAATMNINLKDKKQEVAQAINLDALMNEGKLKSVVEN